MIVCGEHTVRGGLSVLNTHTVRGGLSVLNTHTVRGEPVEPLSLGNKSETSLQIRLLMFSHQWLCQTTAQFVATMHWQFVLLFQQE